MAQPTPVTPRNNPSHALLHNEHYNVMAFGAVGDASADDTTAITNAIAAAYTARASVYFPPPSGYYKATSTIDLTAYPGTHLIGSGSRPTTQGGFAPIVAIVGTGLNPIFKYTGAGESCNLTFENLAIANSICNVKISDAANVRFVKCSFSANSNASADNSCVLLENVFWAWFDNCSFTAPDTASGKGSVYLRGKEPSVNADHCYLVSFRDCRFWNQGVYYHDQNEQAVDAAHAEYIAFDGISTENFASTSAVIEFTKTAGTNWGGRYVMYPSFKNIAFYDFTGNPAVCRSSVPNGIQLAVAENVLAPRLFELTAGTLYRSFVGGYTNAPVVDGSGTALDAYAVHANDTLNVNGVNGSGLRFGHEATGTNLYRKSAGELATDGYFTARHTAGAFVYKPTDDNNPANGVVLFQNAAGQNLFYFEKGTGKINWGAAGTMDTNLFRAAANTLQTDDVLRDHKGTPTYSASITPNATDGDWQTITVTNATAFTINAPTNPPDSSHSQELTIEIFNNSGGAHGAITWNAAFVLVGGALAVIANTKKKFIAFKWNGASWIEVSRASADY